MIDYISTLYDYNGWANQRVLDTVAQLAPDGHWEKLGASFETIHETLVHTMSAQWMWLSRWQGVSPKGMFNPADFQDLAAIQARWVEIEQETRAFVRSLDEAALGQVIEYTTTQGRPKAFPLWQLMVHQVNHATQHRSEIAAMLTQLNHSPGGLDLILYLDLQKNSNA
jgi:uncharacterized damage-inducible protein DinB